MFKDRRRGAIKQLAKELETMGHDVCLLKDNVFDLHDSFGDRHRRIRICLDNLEKHDCDLVLKTEVPEKCFKEIFLKRKGKREFERIKEEEIKNMSIPIF